MLRIFSSLRDLRFGELMEVCSDSNQEKAEEWPNMPRGFALQLAEQDFRQYLLDVFFKTPDAILCVWEHQSHYVSALRLEPYNDGLLLEGLETAPEHRKCGYAADLIRAIQAHLAEQGAVKLYSHVEKRNLASRKTHEKCGFREISDRAVYISGSVDYRCCTYLHES